MENITGKLNSSQQEAVETTEGPVLIIAGAGSGKTKALTHRIAYLIKEKGVRAENILAVTFTNKAAQEMKERVNGLLAGEKSGKMPLIGTFHAVCARILRYEIDKLGYKKNFSILDSQDQLTLAKKILKGMNVNTDQISPSSILEMVSRAKNQLIGAEIFAEQSSGYYEETAAKFYVVYQKNLKSQSALDFDDMIMLAVDIFNKFPEVLEKYQNLFRYILVDEYQDTNHAQYVLVKLLARKYRNICVVGDDWQGIYSWRGANIKNILDFERDYPEAKVIKLEQNYRSTQAILDAAYGVISKNVNRKDKKVWTENKEGHLLVSYEALNEKAEADFIVSEILASVSKDKNKLSDFVVLYRTNAQSRVIEESMLDASLPYRIIGGVKFYQRKEIKDILAYLRVIANFNDEVSLERAIDEPKRGIGPATLKKWTDLGKEASASPIEAGLKMDESSGFGNKTAAIRKFSELISRSREKLETVNLTRILEFIFRESGYEKSLLDGTEIGEMRRENLHELMTVTKKYDQFPGREGLEMFLEEAALVADTDNIDQASEAVHLMTLHSAKGLEFKVVFIAGLEEGILPHSKSLLNPRDLEEERRLMYVGITRAKEKVYFLFTSERNIFGSSQINPPSRFLDDIPAHLVQDAQVQSSKLKVQNFRFRNDEANKPKVKSYRDGDRVSHEVFGNGLVVSYKGDEITVAFSKAGLKKLSASIAPLKKVEGGK